MDASQILAIDDGTFPALLKTLSDPSEEVCLRLGNASLLTNACIHRSSKAISNSSPRFHPAPTKATSKLSWSTC